MKTIIAGSRTIDDPLDIRLAIRESGFHITEVVSGGARGADRLAEYWADEHGVPIRVFPFLAAYGKSGGPMRNQQMAEYADALIAVWDGASRGTANMISTMRRLGKPTYVRVVRAL